MCLTTTCYILWEPTACLQGIEFIHGSIAILIVAPLIHITLWKIHLWNHGIDRNLDIREFLSALNNHIHNRT